MGFDTSAAEEVTRRARGARRCRHPAVCQRIGAPSLAYDRDLPPSVFVCGDDAEVTAFIEQLVRDLGADPVDAGSITIARYVEPAMMLLVNLADAGAEPRDVGMRLLERWTASKTGDVAQLLRAHNPVREGAMQHHRNLPLTAFAIVGVATEVGIEPTARHGADRGLIPGVVTDACGAGDHAAAERSLDALATAGDAILTDISTITGLLARPTTAEDPPSRTR